MKSEVIISNPLPETLIVLSAEVMESVTQLTARAEITDVKDADSLTRAEDLFTAVNQLSKDISSNRLEITRPIDAFKKTIIEVESTAVGPLEKAKKRLGVIITDYRDEQERIRQEAARKAREEAMRKAAEAQKKADEEHAAAVKKAKEQAEEEAILFGNDTPAEVDIPEAIEVDVEMYMDAAVIPAEPLGKSVVRKNTRKELEIFDVDALLAEACKQGGKIAGVTILSVDEKAVRKLMDAGVQVPGARINEISGIAAMGRR